MKKLLVIFGLIGGVVCDAMMPTPFFTTLAHAAPFNCAEYKTRISNQSAKDAAKDIPSWAQGAKPCKKPVSESGNDFAKRLMAAQYPGKAYDTGPSSEYSMIKKFGDRVIPPKRAASKSRINTSPAFSAGRVSLLKPSYAFALE